MDSIKWKTSVVKLNSPGWNLIDALLAGLCVQNELNDNFKTHIYLLQYWRWLIDFNHEQIMVATTITTRKQVIFDQTETAA